MLIFKGFRVVWVGFLGKVRGLGWVYKVVNICVYWGLCCMFMRFLGGLCKVYAVYTVVCIFIRATVKGIFYRSFVRGSGWLPLLAAAGGAGCCCWWGWFWFF